MRSKKLQMLGLGSTRASQSVLWSVLITAIGLSLWAQVFFLPLVDEVRFASPSGLVILAYLLPTLALVSGVVFRAASLTLLGFLVSFVPGIFLLPATSLLETEAAWSMARIGVTLAAYIATASAGAGPEQLVGGGADIDQAQGAPKIKQVDGLYRLYFALRGLILFGLLFVIQYAVFRDPAIAETLAKSYPGRPEAAATFIGVFSFFAWCVAAYSLFFVPLMNVEYNVRSLSRNIDAMLELSPKSQRIRATVWLGLAAVVGVGGWFFSYGI